MSKKLYISYDQTAKLGRVKPAVRGAQGCGVSLLLMGAIIYLTKDTSFLSLLSRLIDWSQRLLPEF